LKGVENVPKVQIMELRRRAASPMTQHPIACHMLKAPHAFDPLYPVKIAQIKETSKTTSFVNKIFSYSLTCLSTRKISGAWKSFVSYPTRPFPRIFGGKRIGGSFERRSFFDGLLEKERRRMSSGTVSR
jgi:hypothetical protein